MKILPNEVYRKPEPPSLETVCDIAEKSTQTVNRIAKTISQKILKRIYDENKFRQFISLVSEQEWLSAKEIEVCLSDLEKETVQDLFVLWMETESLATTTWWASLLFEVGSGDLDVPRNYLLTSSVRALASLYLSKGVVDNRGLTASIEAIPHVGRVAPFLALAEEHPELARMFWAYKSCKDMTKKAAEPDFNFQKASTKFNRKHQSPIMDFIITPKEFIQDAILSWQVKSKAIKVSQSVGQTLGIT